MPNFDDILPMLRSSKRHRIAMLIYPGAVLADIAGPCELFRRARDADGQRQYDVLMCGTSKRVRTDACTLLLEHGLGAVARATTLLVPGTSEPTRALPPAVIEAIQHAAKRKLRIASICTGAFALAAAGLLDGREATTHWAAAAALAAAYPRVRVNPQRSLRRTSQPADFRRCGGGPRYVFAHDPSRLWREYSQAFGTHGSAAA